MAFFSASMQRNLIWVGAALLLAWVISVLGGVLTPFLIAAGLAYLLLPIVNFLENCGKRWHIRLPRILCVLLTEVLALVLALLFMFLLLPIFASELPLLISKIPAVLGNLVQWLQPQLTAFGVPVELDVGSWQKSIVAFFQGLNKDFFFKALSSIQVGGNWFVTVLGNALLIPLALFYFLYEWDWLLSKAQALLPVRLKASYADFFNEVNKVLKQYFRGELLVMLVLALFYSIGLSLFGLDLALPIGVFTGLAVFVPYLGFGLGLVMAILAGVLQFGLEYTAIMVLVVYGIGQLLEGFYLTPYWVGTRLGLHPLAIVFLLMAFGQIFGFVGVLLALPLSAVLAVVLRRLKEQYLASAFYLDKQ